LSSNNFKLYHNTNGGYNFIDDIENGTFTLYNEKFDPILKFTDYY